MHKSLFFSLFLCFSSWVVASEQSELDQVIKQLQSAKAALKRANSEASRHRVQERVYFDYAKAHQEISTVISGIQLYINGERAQPRDPRKMRALTGHYNKTGKK